jgi:hypothetical protein
MTIGCDRLVHLRVKMELVIPLASVLDGVVKDGSNWTISESGGGGFVVAAGR